MENKVSIVIPTYNVENYIEECLNSLRNQPYKNIEIICVDDHSQDGTVTRIEEIQKDDARVKLVLNRYNRGPGYTRNRGLELATGKYIYFLDADDYISEDIFEILVPIAEQKETECIFFDSIMRLESEMSGSRNEEYNLQNIDKVVLNGQELFITMITNNVFSSSVWRQFWRRDFLVDKNIRFAEKLTSAEDAPFTVNAILRGTRMMVINQALHIYRKREGTLSTCMSPQKVIASFYAYCLLLKELSDDNYTEDVKKAVEKRCRQSLVLVKRFYERNRSKISSEDFPEPFERHLFELIVEGKDYNAIEMGTLLKELSKFKYVIIYGDGHNAMDLLHTLKTQNIDVFGFAVTDKTNKDPDIEGIPVKEIGEYEDYKKKAIIIVGVARSNRGAVLNTLEHYEFEHYIDMPRKKQSPWN